MAAGWTDAETKALIAVWGEADVQGQLDSVKRNKDIYQRIAAELSEQGWSKSWKQRYRKVRICDSLGHSNWDSSFPSFFSKISMRTGGHYHYPLL